jgi:uncharacterized protein (TIGR02246 family)
MKRIRTIGLLGCSAVLVGVALASAAWNRGAEDEVRSVLEKQVAAWNKGDLDGFVEWYWNSPKLVFQSGAIRTSGWEAMRDRYRKRYQGEGKEMGKLDFRDLDAIELGPDSAFVRGRWRLAMSNGEKPEGLFTVILQKRPEGWRIIHDHTSN